MPYLTFKEFEQVSRPAFNEKCSAADYEAVCKRSAILINTKNEVIYRKAGVNADNVPRKFIKNPEYLTPEGQRLYGLCQSGVKGPPENHAVMVAQEQEWVKKVMAKRVAQREEEQLKKEGRQRLFPNETAGRAVGPPIVAVKRELVSPESKRKAFKFAGKLTESKEVIDLATPSPSRPSDPSSSSSAVPNAGPAGDDSDEDLLGLGGDMS